VAIANRVLPRFELFWKKQWHELLLANHARQIAPDFLAWTKDQIFEHGFDLDQSQSQSLQLWIGANNSSQKMLGLATAGPHLIIVGPTGSGKSELLKLLLYSLIQERSCDLVLFDFKGGATLEQFEEQAVGLGNRFRYFESKSNFGNLWRGSLKQENRFLLLDRFPASSSSMPAWGADV
jgi:hypothetical protein